MAPGFCHTFLFPLLSLFMILAMWSERYKGPLLELPMTKQSSLYLGGSQLKMKCVLCYWDGILGAVPRSYGPNVYLCLLYRVCVCMTFIHPTISIQPICHSKIFSWITKPFVPRWIIFAMLWNKLYTLQKKSYEFTFKFTIHIRILALRTYQNS